MTYEPDQPGDDVVNIVRGDVSGNVVQVGSVEGGIHHHYYGSRRHVIEQFPAPRPPDAVWLMEQPSRLLDARSQVVRFTGREAELRRLGDWRDSPPGRLSVLLLHAPGGQGKTRLAAEFAERSRSRELPAAQRWQVLQAGFHGTFTSPSGNGTPSTEGDGAGVLLIVDYADRWAHSELERLLHDPVLHKPRPIRVLMISRTVRWYAAVRGELGDLRATVDDLRLPDLADDRFAMFAAARDRYAAPDLFDLPDATRIQPPGPLEHRDFGLTLTLHMAALVAVDAHKRGRRPPDQPHELSAYLLDREYWAWQRLFDAGGQGHGYPTRPAVMARAVFTAALTGAVSHDTGTQALRTLDLPGHPQDLLLDHRFCYPPADRELVLEPLYPDRLAEDFIGLLAPGHDISAYDPDPWAAGVPAILLSDRHNLRPVIAPRAVTFLASAADRWPHVGEKVLYPLLRADPRLALDAGSAALTTLAGIEDIPIDVLGPIASLLPEEPHVDLDIGAAAITATLTTHYLGITTETALRALMHANYGHRLANAGRIPEALDQSRRAVEYFQELAAADRARHLPNLAWSVGNHASHLAAAGRIPEALHQSRHAVECFQELAAADRARYLPGLAATVDNHAGYLARAGRRPEALEYSEQAVRHYGELAQGNPAAYLADLAASTDNHASHLAAAGRMPEALHQSRHAVECFQELAAADRARYLPGLAAAVDNHAKALTDAGQGLEVLAFSQRAVEYYSELAAANRAVHVADLATSVSNHANRLAAAGRIPEAVDQSQRAVEYCHELVAVNHAAYLPVLATSLHNHASHLADAGRLSALEYSRRAVELREELVERDRVAYLPDLARSLWSFTSVRAFLNADLDAAGQAGARAVDLYRELAVVEPAVFTHDLRNAADALARVLDALGHAEEATEIRRDLRARPRLR